MGSGQNLKLKDLIRLIRTCKTAAEERELIAKQSANIRDALREEDEDKRLLAITKLLYLHTLGYPATIGQVECLKMIVSQRFVDKRIGYLGCMMLLDEKQDVHVLITNSLKNDLSNKDQYIQSLALCTLGSICSSEMAKDLCSEVEKLIECNNSYIKKKALLCATRLVRKVPEIGESFIKPIKNTIGSVNQAVKLGLASLIYEICSVCPDLIVQFKPMISVFAKSLKSLISSSFSADYDVQGICDPFLQVKIVKLMRVFGKNDLELSENMSDLLAQITTNTESTKNVGSSVLYETVNTIFHIKADTGLLVLAVNLLGRFLQQTDRNIRYVALRTFKQFADKDKLTIQRHRDLILDCLNDADITIKKAALELCYVMINSSNITYIMKYIFDLLATTDENDIKQYIASNTITTLNMHSSGSKWHIESILTLLKTASKYVSDEAVSSLVCVATNCPELQKYIVHTLYSYVGQSNEQLFLQVGCWAIGEYGEHLLVSNDETNTPAFSEDTLINSLESILNLPTNTVETRAYALMALIKLTNKFSSHFKCILSIIERYSTSLSIELQQRSVEFSIIFKDFLNLKKGLLETMPPIPLKHAMVNLNQTNSNLLTPTNNNLSNINEAKQISNTNDSNALIDLLGNMNSDALPRNTNDNSVLNFLDEFDTLNSSSKTNQSFSTKNAISSFNCFNKNGISISANLMTIHPDFSVDIYILFSNSNNQSVSNLSIQGAVPKGLSLKMDVLNSNIIPPMSDNSILQIVRIANPNKATLKLRLKLSYLFQELTYQEVVDVAGFPSNIYV